MGKKRLDQSGFSLVEVLVAAAILLVSALAIGYLARDSHIPTLDSLKACQDINEEVLAQINGLGSGDFSYVYGTGQNSGFTSRNCPGHVCELAELGLSRSLRWSSGSGKQLTTARAPGQPPSVVKPHLLRLSSINYLQALYNSANYCSSPRTLPSGDFDIFSGGQKNLLRNRGRDGATLIRIQLLSRQADLSCNRPVDIRPASVPHGHTSPAASIVSQPAASDSGFRVEVISRYEEADGTVKSCSTEKDFFYNKAEGYRGQITESVLSTYPRPPLSSRGLPLCSQPDPPVEFSSRYAKAKKDSVLLCRDRSQVGSYESPASCSSASGGAPYCHCNASDGCHNTWASFPLPTDPSGLTLTSPNDEWFPCDQLPRYLLSKGITSSLSATRVEFHPSGNGAMTLSVNSVNTASPPRPRSIRVDVIEVDSALNSSIDRAGATWTTLTADYKGRDPGRACIDYCDGADGFFCGSCPGPCDCPSTAETCACPTWAAANPCDCTPGYDVAHPCECGLETDPCICISGYAEANKCDCGLASCDPCEGLSGTDLICCEDSSDPVCSGGGIVPPPPSCVSSCHPGGFASCEDILGVPGAGITSDYSCTAPFIRCTCP